MSIIKVRKQKNFSIISNIPLNDKSLSFKAKGIWAYLMSKPEDWEVRVSNLINTSTEGRDAIYSGIKELVNAGYMNKIQHRDESGKMTGMEYQVFEDPMNRQAEPVTENPDSDNRDSDNRTQLKTDIHPLPKTELNNDVPAPPATAPIPPQASEPSSSLISSEDIVATVAALTILLPELFQNKPSIDAVIKKALTVHPESYVKNAIFYTNLNSTGGTVPKYRSFLSQCIENHWHDGFEPDGTQNPEAKKAAFLESRRLMPDDILKSDAANGCPASAQVLKERAGK